MSKDFVYTIKKSRRAKHMNLVVHPDGRVVATGPYRVPKSIIESFVLENIRWVQGKIDYFNKVNSSPRRTFSRLDYLKNKKEASVLFHARVRFYNEFYKFSYNKIYIKNQKTRWGSCSTKGNLNLNYKIMFLPEELRDYIIVHEICHLKEMNHSPRFWALVARTFPNHRALRAKLRRHEFVYT
jgi:predicted metal-dependent hydrolase